MAQWYYSSKVNGFFRDDIHGSMPEDVIELTEEQYKMMVHEMNNNGKKAIINDGKILFEKVIIPVTWEKIRSKRNRLLSDTDYTQMSDWPGNKVQWFNYRKELRELPQKFENPEDVVWPTPPSE